MNEWEKTHGEFDPLAQEIRRPYFRAFGGATLTRWRPALNAYRIGDQIFLCFDLAGMKKEDIRVRIEGRRLVVSGARPAPEPERDPAQPMHTHALEIDAGTFERTLEVPDIETTAVTATYRNGLLWGRLPARPTTHVVDFQNGSVP